jgi:hypothetical protein
MAMQVITSNATFKGTTMEEEDSEFIHALAIRLSKLTLEQLEFFVLQIRLLQRMQESERDLAVLAA